MYIKNQIYTGKPTDILYADDGFQLQHKETKLCYGSVSLEDGDTQDNYIEIPEPQDDTDIVD